MPDAAGQDAAARILAAVRGPSRRSGALSHLGRRLRAARSAGEGISLDDKRAMTHTLLRCGASIAEINSVRKTFIRHQGRSPSRRHVPARV